MNKEEIKINIIVLRALADAITRPEVAETVKRFDGKVVNKRFHDALAAAFGVCAWYHKHEYTAGGYMNLDLREAVPADLRRACNYNNGVRGVGDGAFLYGERLNAAACLSAFADLAKTEREGADKAEQELARYSEAADEYAALCKAALAFMEKWSDSVRYTFRSGRDLYNLALDARHNAIFA